MYRIVRIYKEKEKPMWDLAINGVDFYHIANWFYIYSFLGWLWETCYVSVRKPANGIPGCPVLQTDVP